MSEEIWKPVVGFEGAYEVSNMGRVRSLDRSWLQKSRHGKMYLHAKKGRMLRPGTCTAGHQSVALGRGNSLMVHALVLKAFVGPRPQGMDARHLDGNEKNNCLTNLEWSSRGDNSRDKKWHKGAKSYKLKPEEIREIKIAQKNDYRGLGVFLAKKYNVTNSTINSIKFGRIHSDVVV